MINVLQRLAELDAGNPNVVSAKPVVNPDAAVAAIQKNLSEELSSESLKYLAGVKNAIAECGMMPQMPMTPSTPASFSINATAANGDEVAGMLNQIMNLAGVKPVGPTDMPVDKPTTSFSTVPPMAGSGDDMKRMLDTMNKVDSADTDLVSGDDQPEDEGFGDEPAGDEMGMEEPAMDQDDSATGDVDIAGVGGALAGAAIHGDAEGAAKGMQDGEDDAMTGTNDEMRKLIDAVSGPGSLDNAPADPNEVPAFDSDKHAYDPNTGDHRKRQAGLPSGNPMEAVASKLFSDYEEFISEASHQEKTTMKHVKNATAGEKKAAKDIKPGIAGYKDRVAMLKSAEKDGRLKEGEKTMSRAAKGHEKYGKEGMAALAKAGRAGAGEKKLDTIRNKHDKYN